MELILKISQNDLSSVPYIFALKVLRLSSTVFHLLGKKKKKKFCKIIWILPIIKVIWNGCIVIKKIEVKKLIRIIKVFRIYGNTSSKPF